MTIQNQEYYRQRADEELAAAELAVDPSIGQIHREMAQRYHDLISGDASMALPMGGAITESKAVFG